MNGTIVGFDSGQAAGQLAHFLHNKTSNSNVASSSLPLDV